MSIFSRILLQLNNNLFLHRVGIIGTRFMTVNLNNVNMSTKEFEGKADRYNGVLVESSKEYCTDDIFTKKLEASLNKWNEAKKNGIWFKIALEHSNWVPILARNGFDFHHAKSGYVMMCKWLPTRPCGIPVYAHTMFAVGALVINNNSEVLAVKERHFITGHWKFPGGTVDPGENIVDAAIREVKEETSIDFEFSTLVSFMHADKGQFGCSDFYILVAGKALNTDIKKCDREIVDCKWINIQEYMELEDVTDFNKAILNHYLDYEKNNIKITFTAGVHKMSKRDYKLFSAEICK